jgi:hypothetical protein
MEELQGSWFNYVTGEYSDEQPATDDIAKQYIPQDVSSQGLYQCYRQLDLPILKALANVLSKWAGKGTPFPV